MTVEQQQPATEAGGVHDRRRAGAALCQRQAGPDEHGIIGRPAQQRSPPLL
jgi:hypothetical protein